MGGKEGVGMDTSSSAAIKALGSLFSLSQIFLLDDYYTATGDGGCLRDEETKDDIELSKQLSALGLPISFRTSKVTRKSLVGYKKKNIGQWHSYAHEGNEDTEKVEIISGEEYSENLTSSTACDTVEEPEFSGVTSDYSVNYETAFYSESSEVLDNDEIDSKISDESEVWASYWDSFYNRYYFYNTRTNETTWDPPPGMEHLVFDEVNDKPNETIGDDIAENLGSHCSVGSFGESEKDDQLLDQSLCEPCLSFELAGENLNNSTSTLNYSSESLNEEEELQTSCISMLCYNSENLNEEQELKKSCFEETSFQSSDYMDRAEDKFEEQEIDNIIQNPKNCTIQKEKTEDVWDNTKKKKKARKRTRLNKKLSIGSGELYFQGILEECTSQQKDILELSPSISKYWCQRYQLFSKFDNGIKMDEEGWFSATPELIAKHHAFRCGNGVVIDCFTGVGGNAIQFAHRSKHVIAVDIDPKKIEYAQHNAALYGVSDHIDFVVGDSFILAPGLKADTVFLSPPWGGPDYLKATSYDVNTMLKPHGGNILFNAVKGIASKVVMFLPRTADLNQLAELSLSADPPWSLEVERNFLNGKLKAITAYFTDNVNVERSSR